MTNKPRDSEIHYRTHVFCCVNERAPDHPRSCCSARGSIELRTYMKARAKELGIESIRINNAGCLERCELGPNLVIYPEGVWYHYETKQDVDEILERHIINGERVERLYLEPGQKFPAPKVKETLTLEVARIRQETPDTKIMELVSSDGGDLPAFAAGAHIDVFTGNDMRRSYSIASDPTDRRRYVIGVLRETEGRGGSAWMHEEVEQSDSLRVMPPLNNFPLQEDAAEHILIAGGIGISPVLAMGYRLRDLGAKFTLHYCTRSPEQTAFIGEVDEVFGQNVVYHHDGGDITRGIDLNRVLSDRPEGAHLYVCGPAGLMDAAVAAAAQWPTDSIHREYFSAVKAEKKWKNEAFEISLARHKKILTVPADKTILEVVREAGISIDSSCEDGLCSTCRTTLLNGNAEHRDAVLSEKEKNENRTIMICVSRAKGGGRLVLDI